MDQGVVIDHKIIMDLDSLHLLRLLLPAPRTPSYPGAHPSTSLLLAPAPSTLSPAPSLPAPAPSLSAPAPLPVSAPAPPASVSALAPSLFLTSAPSSLSLLAPAPTPASLPLICLLAPICLLALILPSQLLPATGRPSSLHLHLLPGPSVRRAGRVPGQTEVVRDGSLRGPQHSRQGSQGGRTLLTVPLLEGGHPSRRPLSLGLGLHVVLGHDHGRLQGAQLSVHHRGEEGLLHLRQHKVSLHVDHGSVGHLLPLHGLPGQHPPLELGVGGHHHHRLALEASEGLHLPAPGRGVDVGLVQDVVPPPLGRQVQNLVEALRALLDELLPPPVVVPPSAQSVHLHLVDQVVGSQQVVILARVLLLELLRPVSLARPRKTYHHDGLALPPAPGGLRALHDAVSEVQLADGGETRQQGVERAGQLAEVDGEVLVLGEDVGEESLPGQLSLWDPEGDSLVGAVHCVSHDGLMKSRSRSGRTVVAGAVARV